jgi:predicted DNA-binding transcriptional regulator YafY
MAKKQPLSKAPAPTTAPPQRPGVTPERFTRLFKLVEFLGDGPKARELLTAHLGLDVRGFYRDLEVLRTFGIEVTLKEGQYSLLADFETALSQLPYPDPHLTLGEVRQLARGKSAVHRKIQEQIEKLQSG